MHPFTRSPITTRRELISKRTKKVMRVFTSENVGPSQRMQVHSSLSTWCFELSIRAGKMGGLLFECQSCKRNTQGLHPPADPPCDWVREVSNGEKDTWTDLVRLARVRLKAKIWAFFVSPARVASTNTSWKATCVSQPTLQKPIRVRVYDTDTTRIYLNHRIFLALPRVFVGLPSPMKEEIRFSSNDSKPQLFSRL